MNESDFTLRVTIIISFEREILNFRSFLSKSGIKKKNLIPIIIIRPHLNVLMNFKFMAEKFTLKFMQIRCKLL